MNRPSNWAFTVTQAYVACCSTSPRPHPVRAARIAARYSDQIEAVSRYLHIEERRKVYNLIIDKKVSHTLSMVLPNLIIE